MEQGEKLLQDLVSHEKGLLSKVESAKAEAEGILKQAAADAAKAKEDATKEAEALAEKQRASTEQESEAARQSILSTANSEVASIKAAAEKKIDEAVKLVMKQVLP